MKPGRREQTPQALLEVEDLQVTFGDRPILRGVTFELFPGETLIIFGGSGCGKSTLLRSIAGAVEPVAGSIRLFGHSLLDDNEYERDQYRRRIGILFQSGALFNSMSVAENLALILREHTTLTEEEIEILVRMKLEMVGLRHAEELMPSEISGGMKKRAALARALCLDPEIMLYDEPGAGLDPVTLAGVDRLIKTLSRAFNMANIIVTHEIESALRLADRIIFLHEGVVIADESPLNLKINSDPRIQQFLLGKADGPLTEKGVEDDYAQALLGHKVKQ